MQKVTYYDDQSSLFGDGQKGSSDSNVDDDVFHCRRTGDYVSTEYVHITCMMNKMMGLSGSYLDGFRPSMMPPCPWARNVEAGAAGAAGAADDAALVAAETMDETLDMIDVLSIGGHLTNMNADGEMDEADGGSRGFNLFLRGVNWQAMDKYLKCP